MAYEYEYKFLQEQRVDRLYSNTRKWIKLVGLWAVLLLMGFMFISLGVSFLVDPGTRKPLKPAVVVNSAAATFDSGTFVLGLIFVCLVGFFFLIPRHQRGYADYNEYLNSPRWHRLRDKAKKRDGHRCRMCNSNLDLVVHHRDYAERWGAESVDDLTTVCTACHRKHHGVVGA
jgi:hypothetical protein